MVGGSRGQRIVTALGLQVGDVQAGAAVSFTVSGAPPGDAVYLAASTVGVGETPRPALGVTLSLELPIPVASTTADAFGQAAIVATVPAGAAGMEVWLQAAVDGNTSNVVKVWVR